MVCLRIIIWFGLPIHHMIWSSDSCQIISLSTSIGCVHLEFSDKLRGYVFHQFKKWFQTAWPLCCSLLIIVDSVTSVSNHKMSLFAFLYQTKKNLLIKIHFKNVDSLKLVAPSKRFNRWKLNLNLRFNAVGQEMCVGWIEMIKFIQNY